MKIYCCSMMAFSPLINADSDAPHSWAEQIPVLQPAESVAQMAQIAKNYALNRWKPSEGWYGHQVNIMPVTKAFYAAARNALAAAIVDPNQCDEPAQVFNLNEI